ncbi:hypothetical protein [Streptomyces viridochromogenes]|uniref:Putative AAA ATPase n=1 Tax=Streptomyces viridochromogenes Tue57 TaxID=1160705 RepID=L8PLB1_STRVR|nr:hypothetical protein [Streptomyces viridochromogenes]ELS57059.1 putative AAA ATPase [Streptomyces viridochromogenes Tue57]
MVITSNAKRDFPAVFRRRCLPLEMRTLTKEQLLTMVEGQLWLHLQGTEDLQGVFIRRVQAGGTHFVDQLLNAAHMTTSSVLQAIGDGRKLVEMLLRELAKGR